MKTLPGTQQVGEAEGLFVRGGTATESKIFIDGMLVNNFFQQPSGNRHPWTVQPISFKGTVFQCRGLFGFIRASAFIGIDTGIKGLAGKTSADLSVSVIGVGGGIQKLGKDKKIFLGFTYNYTNLAPAFAVIKQRQDFINRPPTTRVMLTSGSKQKRAGSSNITGT